MLENFAAAIELVATVQNLIFACLGIVLGFLFGALPGIGGNVAIGLLIPFTYYLDPVVGIVCLLAIGKGTSFGGSIPAILLNMPGTSQASFTAIDGHQLTQQGKPKKALHTALYASVIGDLFSDIVLLLVAAPIAAVALKVGPPEYAAIADKYGDDDASFFVCRVDESAAASALGKREGVKIVPTCQVYKHGELLETVEGVRPDELDNAVMIAAGDNFVTDPVAVARKILARFGIWGACRKALVSGVRRLRAYFRQPGGVAPSLFRVIDREAGFGGHMGHEVDMFADADNHQLPVFWSRWRCRGSAGRCAFRQDWGGLNLFANPPFVLIAKVVAEARRRSAALTLVCQFDPQRLWWPLVRPEAPAVVATLRFAADPANYLVEGRPLLRTPKADIWVVRLDFTLQRREAELRAQLATRFGR